MLIEHLFYINGIKHIRNYQKIVGRIKLQNIYCRKFNYISIG